MWRISMIARLAVWSLASTWIALVALAPAAHAQLSPPTRVEVAPGISVFQTAPYGDVGLDGNSVVIVTNDGVLVFDANGTPAAARAVLAQIKQLTSKPVRYLVLSHWHWDHWYGAEVYERAFPGLVIVAHEKTRALMAGPAIEFNRPGLEEGLPGHVAEVEADLAKAKAAKKGETPGPADVAALAKHAAADRFFLAQKRGVRPTLPTLTYSDSLTIHLGERTIRVLHHDRAITPGDTYLWLPAERVLVTGDLLINPITFALFCYPSGWISTLHALDALDAAVIVPGHGDPMKDESVLHTTITLLERERQVALGAKSIGRPVADAKAAILADPAIAPLKAALTGGLGDKNAAFDVYLVDWFVKRVYEEADGPLDDSIPKSF
jgi:glyoxylase-like metal-dependent hydrolase (beta-lactamase superfamily II)